MSNPFQVLAPPDLRALLIALKNETLMQLNCCLPGTIVSFDAGNQTASIQPLIQRVVFNTTQDTNQLETQPTTYTLPILTGVPVFVNSGGGGVITFPVAPGDSCLIIFGDRDIDNWWISGAQATPNTGRAHSLSDGFALVGFRNKTNPVGDYSTTDVQIKKAGGVISIAAKLGISNASTSLLTCLNDVINALTAINAAVVALGGADSSAEISTASSAITSLLK